MVSWRVALCFTLPLLMLATLGVSAQRGRQPGLRFASARNLPYDGRFTFVRIQYDGYTSWAADYPAMEQNLTTILHEITKVGPRLDGTNVHSLDDPELPKFPVAYLTEPGFWFPSESEVLGLRDYLRKGGFLIVDDFHFPEEWNVFEAGIRRVLPAARIEPLALSHPIFDSFFRIESLKVPYPGRLGEQGLMAEFTGIHEENDPNRRLMVVINYNVDLGDYVEWSAQNLYNPTSTNEAYKFMINYVMYGLTR